MNHEGSTFLSGWAPFDSFIFFSKESDELAVHGHANSSFFVFDEEDAADQFRKYDESVAWVAIAMATIKPTDTSARDVVAVSPQGDYWEVEAASAVESLGRIERVRGHIRALSVISEKIYGCGMGRMALLRESRGVWRDFGPPDSDGGEVVGFEGIDGFGPSDIYAVGWGGEIWHYRNGEWRQVDSPVSSVLSAVCCGDDGVVYAVGHDGVLVRGRNDKWEVVETGRSEQLMDVRTFDRQVYVATNFSILRLTEEGLVRDEDYADNDRPSTCLHLLRAADGLVSLGTKDLWRKKNGLWRRLV